MTLRLFMEHPDKVKNTRDFRCFKKPLLMTMRFCPWWRMVEKGLGIAILPKLILQRITYDVMVKPLDVDAYRTIGIAMKNKKELSLAARCFLEYLDFRDLNI